MNFYNQRQQKIDLIKEEVFNLINNNNGKLDLVDIACEFKEYTTDIPCLAVAKLIDEGRIERKALYGIQYAYFVKYC